MSDGSLPTFRFPASTHLVQVQPPQHGSVTMGSSALEVFTDLAQIRAATVPPQTSLGQAELKMIYQGVRLLFVVSDMPSVDGILTAAFKSRVPIFCPAFSDCSAGLGIVAHYHERLKAGRGTRGMCAGTTCNSGSG